MESVKSVQSFIDLVQKYYKEFKPKKHLFFRGHEKTSYELIPSVFRNGYIEKDIILDFKQYAPEHSINYNFISERDKVLTDMQHYGLPTRLLDWTIAPLIALYFACQKSKQNTKIEDGRIFVLNPWDYNNRIVDYNKTNIHHINILSRALLSSYEFSYIKDYILKEYNYLLTEDEIRKPFSYVALFTNKRKIQQRGCFTINGIDQGAIDKWDEIKDNIRYITIERKNKKTNLDELNQLYINDYSVFPDFDGMSSMVKKYGSLFNLNHLKNVL